MQLVFPHIARLLLAACLCASLFTSTADAQQPGIISTVAGGGSWTELELPSAPILAPSFVRFDGQGRLLLVDVGILMRIDLASGKATRLAGEAITGGEQEDIPPFVERPLTIPPLAVRAVQADAQNNLYLADYYNHRVHVLRPDGTLHVFAGNGSNDSSGDGGPATDASLMSPIGLTLDSQGNLYICDSAGDSIRKVTPQGIISTYKTLNNPIAITVDKQDRIYVSTFSGAFFRFNPDGSTTTLNVKRPDGVTAATRRPVDLAIDADGRLLIAEENDFRIWRADLLSGTTEVLAGNGRRYPHETPYPPGAHAGDGGPAREAHLSLPRSVAVDPSGRVVIADQANRRVRVLNGEGIIQTLVRGRGDGIPGPQSRLNQPMGLSVDALGQLYVADTSDFRVRKLDAQGITSTFAGSGYGDYFTPGLPLPELNTNLPRATATDLQGNVYFSFSSYVVKVGLDNKVTVVAGGGTQAGDSVPATSAKLIEPHGIALDTHGNLYIADTKDQRIRRVDPKGILTTLVPADYPLGITVDRHGMIYYTSPMAVFRVDPTVPEPKSTMVAGYGVPAENWKSPGEPFRLGYTGSVAVDSEDNLFIPYNEPEPAPNGSMVYKGRLIKIDKDQHVTLIAGGEEPFREGMPANGARLGDTRDITIDRAGNVYLSERDNGRIYKVAGVAAPGLIAGQPFDLQLLPAAVELKAGETHRFAVAANIPATWSVVSGEGSIDADGTYRAPDVLTASSTATLKATATDGTGRVATASVRLTVPLGAGDVNGDAQVNVGDAILVLRSLVGLEELDAEQKRAADLTGEGEVTVGDVVLILRKAVGML